MAVYMDSTIIVDYCEAPRRTARKWEQKQTTWREFAARCCKPIAKNMSREEYANLSKDERGKVKDVGGFVGAVLSGGVRKATAVDCRTMATLDLDNATADTVERVKAALAGVAFVMYSTASHTPIAPRYRIVIPFNHKIASEQYEPICRRIAERIGINEFDCTTYDTARLFYWGVKFKDDEYFCLNQAGAPLDVQEYLDSYTDWRDVSLWAFADCEKRTAAHEAKLCGEPTEKPGIIGAFCRAYTIREAIEKHLGDVYEPTYYENRYTYKPGHQAAGLLVYDDKFAYAHNATDPASHQTLNAFDLCRVHLFVEKDRGKTFADITAAPSYKAMCDYAERDEKVHKLYAKEIADRAKNDFEAVNLEPMTASGADWREQLEITKGKVLDTPGNRRLIAQYDTQLQLVWYNQFNHNFTAPAGSFGESSNNVNDDKCSAIADYIEEAYKLKIPHREIKWRLLYLVKAFRSHNPVKEYITAVEWDNAPRLDSLLIDYLGADNTPLTKAITRKWFCAAVARVFEPGVKFDNVLTLAGAQGIGKSIFLATLAGDWFNDTFALDSDSKTQMESVQASWIVEMGELKGMKKADVETVKAFISRQVDKFRRAYGQNVDEFPRHNVFAATTNEEYFLRSLTGDRRFWVVNVNGGAAVSAWLDRLRGDVPQIWAEAYAMYKAGEPLYLSSELEQQAREQQAAHNEIRGSGVVEMLEAWLDEPLPADWGNHAIWTPQARVQYWRNPDPIEAAATAKRDFVCPREVIAEFCPARLNGERYSSQMVNRLLESCSGWKRAEARKYLPIYGYSRGFERVESNEDNI